ncbi:MAG: MBL fold metallo-hydrolase [Steroidobacteraceae bacterium]|jgi:glyoxylase-like metal-dependent hydrolase (beta-lactamase superfamily II)|nr:MBL fold metallo-hydrolase [Steroidobacteraceae bacterium]
MRPADPVSAAPGAALATLEFPLDFAPELGGAVELVPGVHWARLPVPGALRHINVWLLQDAAGWTLVDTGMNVEGARAAWTGGLRDQLDGRPLHRIVCTHHHPDHAGLAAFLLERHPGAEVWMSAGEDAVMQRLASTWLDPRVRDARIAAYAAEGLAVTEQLRPYVVLDSYRGAMSGIPRVARHFADGEVLETGAHRWRAIALRGHTDEQLVFANEAARLLIAGDQVLPRITSNVGIYPERADEDPVASYLASFDRLAELPPDTLVLPSHGNPFRGLHARLGQLRRHHELTLARLREQLDVPRTAVELAQRLFVRELDPLNTVLATGETLAHVRHLVARGEAAMTEDPATGLRRYVGVG